jgi:hypothetical protein
LQLLALSSRAGLLCLLVGIAAVAPAVADDWLPVMPDELHMDSEPQAPGAAAIYLYRQVDRDDANFLENNYVRLKILTQEGLKYASVEIPFDKNMENIRSIEARTIRQDGSIAKFDGTVYEKPIIQTTGAKLVAKAFTLPEAEVGSIIEYRYRRNLAYGWVFNSHWILSQELFTKHAKFSLQPNTHFGLQWSWPRGVPPGTDPPKSEYGRVRLETHDVPAFVTEEYMPPENELRYRIDFLYDADPTPRTDPVAFWKERGKRLHGEVERFADGHRLMEKAVAEVVQPTDTLETKLRKLYARTQVIRNLSYESESEQEASRQKTEPIHGVEDVWKRGYGDATQITWLFLSMARAAGAQAFPVLVATRDSYFFDPRLMNAGELNSNLVLIKLDGKELFLNPGVPFTPFGLLPWYETAVQGLKLDKDGGAWVHTPLPAASDSRIERKAALSFDRGTVSGKVMVTYTGLEASWRRLQERGEDETARRQFLEDSLSGSIPTGINVKLVNAPDWNDGDAPLVAEYDIEVPGWAAPAGRHALVPLGLFSAQEKHTFERATRVQPLYFYYPYSHADDVTIDLPSPWLIDSVPQPRTLDLGGVAYKTLAENRRQSLHITRELTLNVDLVNVDSYSTMRRFYEIVRTGDEEQAVLSPSAGPLRQ